MFIDSPEKRGGRNRRIPGKKKEEKGGRRRKSTDKKKEEEPRSNPNEAKKFLLPFHKSKYSGYILDKLILEM